VIRAPIVCFREVRFLRDWSDHHRVRARIKEEDRARSRGARALVPAPSSRTKLATLSCANQPRQESDRFAV